MSLGYRPYYTSDGTARSGTTVTLGDATAVLDRRAKERNISRADLARRILEIVLDDPAELDRLLTRWKAR